MESKKTLFDPNKHLQDIKGKPYLPVAWRLVWFREEHPDWSVETEEIEKVDGTGTAFSKFKATIKNADGRIIATAHKREDKSGFPDYAEKAETGSIGRALAMCGYGTQFSPEIDEGEERVVDSPVTIVETKEPKFSQQSVAIRKMYFAVANEKGITADAAKTLAKNTFKSDSFTKLTNDQLTKLIEAISKRKGKVDDAQ